MQLNLANKERGTDADLYERILGDRYVAEPENANGRPR